MFDTMPAYDITIYAKWIDKTYTLSFVTNSDDIIAPLTGILNSSLSEPLSPTKTGHTFDGWYRNLNFTTPFIFDTMPSYNQTIYAKFSPNSYVLTYDTQSSETLLASLIVYGDDITKLSTPTKAGYAFNGWYMDLEINHPVLLNTMPAYDFTVYASWTLDSFKIIYQDEGLILFESAYLYSSLVPSNITPEPSGKVGHTFSHWSKPLPDYMISSDLVIDAIYEPNTYNITFVTNQESLIDPVTHDYLAPINLSNPTQLGYSFMGWYTDIELQHLNTWTHMPAHDLSLFAKWSINSYTMTFQTNNESPIDAITQAYQTPINVSDPIKTGYLFSGWYTSNLWDQTYNLTTMPAENITLYAKWDITSYDITFKPIKAV